MRGAARPGPGAWCWGQSQWLLGPLAREGASAPLPQPARPARQELGLTPRASTEVRNHTWIPTGTHGFIYGAAPNPGPRPPGLPVLTLCPPGQPTQDSTFSLSRDSSPLWQETCFNDHLDSS